MEAYSDYRVITDGTDGYVRWTSLGIRDQLTLVAFTRGSIREFLDHTTLGRRDEFITLDNRTCSMIKEHYMT